MSVLFLQYLNKEKVCHRCHNNKEKCVETKEQFNVMACFFGIKQAELAECDKTCKGCNRCAAAAYVYAQKQFAVVIGKMAEQNCRRNIADELTAGCCYKQSAALKKAANKFVYCRNS